ncbi:CPCC family cysteine-rich protein [Marinobacterium mangrovicola]|uniref:Cysteine-rich CPCC n=1 Tax=Marinobacterium mangrovicola TaxID=1476959 RepID=A0A4R1GKU2_9GAMM|nr:CPCC family cysteine-rich protein [Marinobacterium mangrovicola]TCK08738.1 Cysteine-rich CPCC [Marinobacterium mangrovicola]
MNSIDREQAENGLYACPCCGYATLRRACRYDICSICFWEDDGEDDDTPIEYRGGPNGVTLEDGRINFQRHGVSDLKDAPHVRAATAEDIDLRHYRLEYDLESGWVVKSDQQGGD